MRAMFSRAMLFLMFEVPWKKLHKHQAHPGSARWATFFHQIQWFELCLAQAVRMPFRHSLTLSRAILAVAEQPVRGLRKRQAQYISRPPRKGLLYSEAVSFVSTNNGRGDHYRSACC